MPGREQKLVSLTPEGGGGKKRGGGVCRCPGEKRKHGGDNRAMGEKDRSARPKVA